MYGIGHESYITSNVLINGVWARIFKSSLPFVVLVSIRKSSQNIFIFMARTSMTRNF